MCTIFGERFPSNIFIDITGQRKAGNVSTLFMKFPLNFECRENCHNTEADDMNLPPPVPRNRGNKSIFTASVLCIALIGAALWTSPVRRLAIFFSCGSVLIFIGQTCIRVCQLAEEITHLEQRYENSLWLLLRRIFYFNTSSCVFLITVIFIMIYEVCPEFSFTGERELSFSLMFLMCYICLHVVIDVQHSGVHEAMCVERLHGLDCGSAFAHSYFDGYLKFVLPDHGDENRGIKEKIADFKSKHSLTDREFPVAKLFVVISSSMYTSNDLSDMSHSWMEPAGNLNPVVKNRAGVMNRKYRNSVYRIKIPGSGPYEHTYVVAEGASPLRSLYDYTKSAGIKRALLKEVTALFYKTLLKIIQDTREVEGLCELIYIDDESCKGINIAQHILQRIEEIQKQPQ